MIKCRAVAGDLELGKTFCDEIQPFVFRRFLGAAEIAEIKSLKRRIEQRTLSAGTAEVEVKTGHGGIRDIEFVVQFLQLLHGGEYAEVRHPTTLTAIAQLERVGCLSTEERIILDDNYRFLRRVEHRLQILFDRQTHEMPRDALARQNAGPADGILGREPVGRLGGARGAVHGRLSQQDRAESPDSQSPAPRCLQRR